MNPLATVIAGAAAGLTLAQRLAAMGPPAPPALPTSSSSGFGIDGGGGGSSATMQWFEALPKTAGAAREQAIFEAFQRKFYRSINWVPVTSSATVDGVAHTLELYVMDDCLAIGTDSDFIRVSMSARTQQAIADSFVEDATHAGAYLCTSRIADLVAANAVVRIPPMVMSARPDIGTQHMSETWVMLEYHREIEHARAGRSGLLSDAGKYWVASSRLGTAASPARVAGTSELAAANYGFFVLDKSGNYAPRGPQGSHVGTGGWSHGPGRWAVWQNVGLAHNLEHADYSQTCRLVGQYALLDGASSVDIQELASDPKLCALVSDEGPVLLRNPGIPAGALLAS